jgi:hypothetical protein
MAYKTYIVCDKCKCSEDSAHNCVPSGWLQMVTNKVLCPDCKESFNELTLKQARELQDWWAE